MESIDLPTDELIKRAEELEEAGQKREALEYFRTALSRCADPAILCQYGDLAADLGEWAEAEDAYLCAIPLAPQWAGPFEGLAVLYMETFAIRNLELAQEYLKKSLELEKTAHAFTLLGVVQARLGLNMEARRSYHEALRIDPAYEEAHYNLALTYRQESPAHAVALLRKALESDSEYQQAHRELGWMLKRLSHYNEAEVYLRKSIELDDQDGWAHIYLGNLLWTNRELVSAERHYKYAIDIWPDESVPYWCIAHFYECLGRRSEADFFYEKALQLDPDDPQANLRFGVFLKEIGETSKAKLHLERVLNLDPNDEQAGAAMSELE